MGDEGDNQRKSALDLNEPFANNYTVLMPRNFPNQNDPSSSYEKYNTIGFRGFRYGVGYELISVSVELYTILSC